MGEHDVVLFLGDAGRRFGPLNRSGPIRLQTAHPRRSRQQSSRRRRTRQHVRRLRSPILGGAARVGRLVFGTLSWTAAQRLGASIGSLAWRVCTRDRRRMLTHLEMAFPELDADQRRRWSLECFRHLGTSLGELLHLWHRPEGEAERHVDVQGFEIIEALRREGRPILVLTGHCGNWELLSTANHSHGLGLAAMARQNDDAHVDRVILALRQHFGSLTIARGGKSSSRNLLKTLRSGGALAMLIDQDIATDGVWVPFFGRPAFTPLAAASLSLRLGATAVPTFVQRLDDGRHIVRFHEPLDLPPDPEAATAIMTAAIEAQIRRCPAQWVWMHRRWRRQPEATTAESTAEGG